MKKTIILVHRGKAKEIVKVFGVTKGMVSSSLRGHRNSELAKKIRHVALTQYGGVELEPVNRDSEKDKE